jgi:hypothetical protein
MKKTLRLGQRTARDGEKMQIIAFEITGRAFGDIRRDRRGCTAKLAGQPVELVPWKGPRGCVNGCRQVIR